MVYEFYLDIQIAEDFLMNLLLLSVTAKLLRRKAGKRRTVLAAMCGALLHTASLLAAWSWPGAFRLWLPAAAVIGALMLKTALNLPIRGERRGEWLGAFAAFYGAAFFMAGIMELLSRGARMGLLLFGTAAAAAYGVLQAGYSVYAKLRQVRGTVYEVKLSLGGSDYQLRGLLDTGNRLSDPIYHRPVHIMDMDVFGEPDEEKLSSMGFHLIPYHSIARQEGILWAVIGESMEIRTEQGNRTVEKPIIGLSRIPVSSRGDYQLILHEEGITGQ